MKTNFLVCLFIFLNISYLFSQSRFSIHPGIGYFIYHSDNNLDITDDENLEITLNTGLGLGYKIENEYELQLEAEYISSVPAEVLESKIVNEYGQTTSRTYFVLSQNSLVFDISIIFPFVQRLDYGIGLSLGFLDRTIERKNVIANLRYKDILTSAGIGANFYLCYSIPIKRDSNFALQTNLKMRYLYSVWFDDRGRNLDKFQLHYVNAALYFGLSYQL